jgi:hypothetical protein
MSRPSRPRRPEAAGRRPRSLRDSRACRTLLARVEAVPSGLRFVVLLAVVAAVVVGLLHLLLVAIGPPSEISTWFLIGVLAGVILISGAVIAAVLYLVHEEEHREHRRLALVSVCLLVVGGALAVDLLPEHNSAGTSAGAVGVLPPAPATHGHGFEVGLVARPHGCSESVPVRLVVDGSQAYWSEHPAPPSAWQRFVIVLPGRFGDVKFGLGRADTVPVEDPEQAHMVGEATREELRRQPVVYPGKRDLTIVTGAVENWSQSTRPVIVTADAPWITRRGVNDCNLQLPALAGEPGAVAVAEALTCPGLDRFYAAGTCTDPPASPGGPQGEAVVSAGLEVGEGAAMVVGSDIAGSESVPQPVDVGESPGWRCRAPTPGALLRLPAAEAGSGSASVSVASSGDCHAVATVLASSWRRDFLLVLISALVAVGVHMMFQALVESPTWRARRRGAPPQGSDPGAGVE